MFWFLLMAAMHGLLDFGSDKNAIGTFGFSVPFCVKGKVMDGGVISTCIRGVG